MSRDWRDLLLLRRLIARRLFLSRLSLGIERFTAALWGPLLLLGVFAVIVLFDILPALPLALHWTALIIFGAAFVRFTYLGCRALSWPSALEARHLLETSSGVEHRPLTAWEDNLGYKAGTGQNTLWMAHRLRMQHLIERLIPPWPSAVATNLDPYALRGLLVLLITIGSIGAWGNIGPRFVRAVNPVLVADTGIIDVKVWLTPPTYTQKPPVLLDPTLDQELLGTIETPIGTQVLAVVMGTKRPTRLAVESHVADLIVMDDNSQRYEGILPVGDRLELLQAKQVLGSWPLTPLPDAPPTIALTEIPEATGRFRLRFKYSAKDDYGVAGVAGEIDRPEETRPYAQNWGTDFTLSIPPLSPKKVEHQSYHDLTAHPWAGESVFLRLTAKDAAGQTGSSEAVQFRLPERLFTHPVAATIIRYRKDLIADPTAAPMAARALGRLMEVPESYGGDIIAHLAMSSARGRLILQDATEVMDSVIDLMWRAALRIEDGAFAVADQALQDAENALEEAIGRDAPPEEISYLIGRLQRALLEYYQALSEKMPEGSFPFNELGNDMRIMGSQDLTQMMEQLRQLSEMGAENAAREMMANLRNLLEALRNAALSPMSNPDVEAAQRMMEELRDITEQQSNMLNETFDRARQEALRRNMDGQTRRGRNQRWRNEMREQTPPKQAQDPGFLQDQQEDAAEDQNALRHRLGDLMGRMAEMTGDLTEGLGQAEEAMRDAESALRDGSWRSASDAQAEALANLQQGMEGSAQKLMQALAEKGLAGLIPMPGPGIQPFGAMGTDLRRNQNEDIELPTEPDTRGLSQKSRAILDEIRRRAGQRLRPREEREYLRRLLEQF